MTIRYRVELTAEERDQLSRLLSAGKCAVRRLKRAQILLAAEAGATDEEIARTIGVAGATVYRTKRRLVVAGLEAALSEGPRPGAERKLTGKEEALLIATACSKPPAGRARWTLELLAGEMVRLTSHDGLSRETVRRRLAENDLKPWRKHMWCIPKVDAEYVARMEDGQRHQHLACPTGRGCPRPVQYAVHVVGKVRELDRSCSQRLSSRLNISGTTSSRPRRNLNRPPLRNHESHTARFLSRNELCRVEPLLL
jgi:transposase